MASSTFLGVGIFEILILLCAFAAIIATPVLLVVLIVDRRKVRPSAPAETPRQILDRRLAAGEISLEEHARLLGAMDPSCDGQGHRRMPEPGPSG